MKFARSQKKLPELRAGIARKQEGDCVHHPQQLEDGDVFTPDHRGLNEENEPRLQHRCAFCSLRNMQDKLAQRKSQYETRFGTPFDGPVKPSGAEIFENPFSMRETSLVQRCVQEHLSDTR